MSWEALPRDVVALIWMARRRAMARELCVRESRQRALDRRVWPLGVSPRACVAYRHEAIVRWCDRRACGRHDWIEAWSTAARLWCQVCNRDCRGVRFPHPGRFCGPACYAFV